MSSARNHQVRSHKSERVKRSIIGSSARKVCCDMSVNMKIMSRVKRLVEKLFGIERYMEG